VSKGARPAKKLEVSTLRLFYEIHKLNCWGETDFKFPADAGSICNKSSRDSWTAEGQD
jgi:hypothetical protein